MFRLSRLIKMRAIQLQVQARFVPFWKQMTTIGRSLLVIQQVQKNEAVSKSQYSCLPLFPFPTNTRNRPGTLSPSSTPPTAGTFPTFSNFVILYLARGFLHRQLACVALRS